MTFIRRNIEPHKKLQQQRHQKTGNCMAELHAKEHHVVSQAEWLEDRTDHSSALTETSSCESAAKR